MERVAGHEMEELTEILARGCLRLILKDGETLSKRLKRLDSSRVPSDQLDRKLTTFEKGRRS